MSLRARLALAAGVAVALAVIAVAVSAYAGTRSQLQGQLDDSLRGIAAQYLHPRVPGGGPGGGFPGGGGGSAPFARPGRQSGGDCDRGLGINGPQAPAFGGATGFVQLVSPSGAICRGSSEQSEIPADPRAESLAKSGTGQYFTDKTVGGVHIRVFVTGIRGLGALEVALPLTSVDKALSSQLLLLIVIAAAGVALAALLGVLVARAALAPIARFTRQTEAIAASPELIEHERLEVGGSDELARLAQTFNSTLDALAGAVRAQRNLVADASHELRTPIATIRANLQLMRDEAQLSAEDRAALRADVIDELDELTALVSDVVELARGGDRTAAAAEIRVDEVVAQLLDRSRRRAPRLRFEAHLEPTLVRGEGDRIARATANLLDNAVKWSPDGGLIEVELADGVLAVRDHGPGFHAEDLPFVFDRFHRAKDARAKPGSGLGLAIVRQAAESHGGFVEAMNAETGGAVLRVSFGPVLSLPDDGPAAGSGASRSATARQA